MVRARMTAVTKKSFQLMTSIMMTSPANIKQLETIDTMLCSRAVCTLSASLVKRLISSP